MATKRFILDDILSDAEKAQLEAFNANPLMVEAVRKVLLFPIYTQGLLEKGSPSYPLSNWLLKIVFPDHPSQPKPTDEQAGHDLKVKAEAIALIENFFTEIEVYKAQEEFLIPKNPVR